ncbi:MAG: hypothetical protein JW818_06950 [Pirellulales bacterium]|nr:hypothetical protein [Pirellulales bacterium]
MSESYPRPQGRSDTRGDLKMKTLTDLAVLAMAIYAAAWILLEGLQ